MNPTVMIGIDPGYDRIGWAIGSQTLGQLTVLEYGCILTDKKSELQERYQTIIKDLNHLLQTYSPTEAAIETLFFSKNQTTAMDVSEARGVIISCLLQHHCGYVQYHPNQIKIAVTGYGNADKKAVEKMVRLQMKIDPSEKIIDDTIDALGILLTHSVSRNSRT